MTTTAAIDVSHVSYDYGKRRALDDLSLSIDPGEIFVLLGPNGGGKTTLFRLLATLIPPQQGDVRILGLDVRTQTYEVRLAIGVVFQAASLDKKLSVNENLACQGALYGLGGTTLRRRQQEMLTRLGLADRARDKVETLSGGLRRRVDLAKGMMHHPRLLLLDEPSTGLDPNARSDLWNYLEEVRAGGVTVVLTTHLLEEAERADRIAILNQGKLVALDTPANLRALVGGDSITIQTADPEALAKNVRERLNCPASVVDGSVRLELEGGHAWIPKLVDAFPDQIQSLTLGKPTLEDVFIARTGHRFWNEGAPRG